MFNGDFIVKQSKFLLFVTILYLKDYRYAHNNPIFDFDFDLISDILSLTEDLMNLSRSYGDYETTKYFLPQHKWVIRNEDIHLNYSQLIKKYGLSEDKQSEANEDAVTLMLLKIPSDDHEESSLHTLAPNANEWITSGVKGRFDYHLASKECEEWIGRAPLSKEILHSPSNSDYMNLSGEREVGELDLRELFGIVYYFTEMSNVLYVGSFYHKNFFYVLNSENLKYNTKITLTETLSVIVWISRLISAFIKLIVKLNRNIYLFVPVLGCDSTQLTCNHSLVYIIQNVLCNYLPLAFILYINYSTYCNWLQIKRPLSLPEFPKKAKVKNVKCYVKSLVNSLVEKFSSNKKNEETSLVLYESKEQKTSCDNKLTWLLPMQRYDNPLHSKLLNIINYYWTCLMNFNFILSLRCFINLLLNTVAISLKKGLQILSVIENVNYITISS